MLESSGRDGLSVGTIAIGWSSRQVPYMAFLTSAIEKKISSSTTWNNSSKNVTSFSFLLQYSQGQVSPFFDEPTKDA